MISVSGTSSIVMPPSVDELIRRLSELDIAHQKWIEEGDSIQNRIADAEDAIRVAVARLHESLERGQTKAG